MSNSSLATRASVVQCSSQLAAVRLKKALRNWLSTRPVGTWIARRGLCIQVAGLASKSRRGDDGRTRVTTIASRRYPRHDGDVATSMPSALTLPWPCVLSLLERTNSCTRTVFSAIGSTNASSKASSQGSRTSPSINSLVARHASPKASALNRRRCSTEESLWRDCTPNAACNARSVQSSLGMAPSLALDVARPQSPKRNSSSSWPSAV